MSKRIFQKALRAAFYFSGTLLFISIIASFLKPSGFSLFSFIALFFPLLWIFNALFLLFFLIIRSRLAIVSLILFLTGIYQVSLIYNFSGGEKSGNRANKINLISFNTGNADTTNALECRKEAFENELFYKSDIICLQEFIPENAIGIDILENFKNKINVDFYGIADGDSSGLSVYTNYEIVDFGWLKQELDDTYALWCTLNIGNDTITIINVQLQSIRLEDEELESMTKITQIYHLPGHFFSIYAKLKRGFLWREEQVENLKKLINSSEHPVVLCGDFNDPPSSFTYREISKLLRDAFLEKGKGFGFTYAGRLPFLRIDYFMVSEEISISTYQKINKTHSDHYPLSVQINY